MLKFTLHVNSLKQMLIDEFGLWGYQMIIVVYFSLLIFQVVLIVIQFVPEIHIVEPRYTLFIALELKNKLYSCNLVWCICLVFLSFLL